ncbi:hypothetical protein ACFL6C_04480 [Myxococcota bacterium]
MLWRGVLHTRPAWLCLLAVGVITCGPPPPPRPASGKTVPFSVQELERAPDAQVTHYRGQLTKTSLEGRIIYGVPRLAALRLHVIPSQRRMAVHVVAKGTRHTLLFVRVGASNRFEIISASGALSGVLTVEGNEWLWDRWHLEMHTDGDTQTSMIGRGSVSRERLTSERWLLDAEGNEHEKLMDEFVEISRAEYQQLRSEIETASGPTP